MSKRLHACSTDWATRNALLAIMIAMLSASADTAAEEAVDLSFRRAGDGQFTFDTGLFRGRLQADDKGQGIPSFVDVRTGRDLAYGGSNPGLLSPYRVLLAGDRWGDTARTWPKSARLLDNGGVRVDWPPGEDHPLDMSATYQWRATDTLDLTITVTPRKKARHFELFLSSYFTEGFETLVYAAPTRHMKGEPAMMTVEACPLLLNSYLAFPRDREAAQTIFDGRWDRGSNPVHFSVTRFMAAPLALKRDTKTGITFAMMSPPSDCFAIETPYALSPPDGVAGHRSLYASLFGQDLDAGQSATARVRLVVGREVTDQRAIECYRDFIQSEGEGGKVEK